MKRSQDRFLASSFAARIFSPVSLLALGLLGACGGKQLGGGSPDGGSGGSDGGVYMAPDGATCVDIDLSTYDQSCAADSDCISITAGPICEGSCECGGATVNASEQSRYQNAIAPLASTRGVCGCFAEGIPQCVHGTCTFCSLGSNGSGCIDGGAVGSDAGGSEGGSTGSLPPGALIGVVTGVPASCVGDTYFQVPASHCGFLNCPGRTAYAICDGSSYTACDCEIPAGYTLTGR